MISCGLAHMHISSRINVAVTVGMIEDCYKDVPLVKTYVFDSMGYQFWGPLNTTTFQTRFLIFHETNIFRCIWWWGYLEGNGEGGENERTQGNTQKVPSKRREKESRDTKV